MSEMEVESYGRWWQSLSVRLAAAINSAALLVLGAFWLGDLQRTRATYYAAQTRRLVEEAQVLRAAQAHFMRHAEFQEFVDTFCRQMDTTASPGHHIVVFGPEGAVVARAHERPSAALEQRMHKYRSVEHVRFRVDNEDFVAVAVAGSSGTRISVAQSLAPVRGLIRAQATSRAASLGVLAIVIFAVTIGVVLVWVHAPLRSLVRGLRAIGGGRFNVRLPLSGSAELRYLAASLNELIAALDAVDADRRRQMKRARSIQTRLLPNTQSAPPAFRVDAAFRPADSVGGDFYDLIPLADGSLLIAVFDVSGHGVAAALHTCLLRTVLHYEAKNSADPGTIVTAMNREFASVSDAGEFATCCVLRLSADGRIEYTSAGHDAPTIVTPDGAVRKLSAGALAVGVVASESYRSARATLAPCERLYLFTDGLYEVVMPDGELAGRRRLIDLFAAPDDVVEQMRRLGANGRFADDVTLIRIQRARDARPSRPECARVGGRGYPC